MLLVFALCIGIAALIVSTAKKKGDETLGWILASFVVSCALLLSTLFAFLIGILIEIIVLVIPKHGTDQEKPKHHILYTIIGIIIVLLVIFRVMAGVGNMMWASL